MRESVLEVLIYLVERHMQDDYEPSVEEADLIEELKSVGFHDVAIGHALRWLAQFFRLQRNHQASQEQEQSIRLFNEEECMYLDTQCRGFIMMLEQSGVLDSEMREMVIDRVMALDPDRIDLSMVKWVTLIVLCGEPRHDAALAMMERLVLEDLAEEAQQ